MSGWEGWVCVCVWGGGLIIEIFFFRVGGGVVISGGLQIC